MAENYKGHRIGSRKASIRQALDEQGEEAATKLGAELGLSPATVRGWVRTWQKGSDPATAKVTAEKNGERTWVHWKCDPEAKGYIVKAGDEQSVVKWRNGNETVVVNSWIEPD